jgi:uncharacterized membrane protein
VEKSSTGLTLNTAGLLCYLGGWITGLIFFVIEKESKFVTFHAMQSLVTFAGFSVVVSALSWIPYAGTAIGGVLGAATFVFWIIGMVTAWQGKRFKFPIVGNWAEQQVG